MRKIKFRAWNGKKMHYNVTPWQWDFCLDTMHTKCIENTGNGILGSGGDTAVFEVQGIRFKNIMQFTGLHDKNGKEIYEGDILSFWNKNRDVVNFENGCFSVFGEPLGWDFDSEYKHVLAVMESCEIIGNIHENPNLI